MPSQLRDRRNPPLPYDPEREYAAASFRTKQLVVLATDVLVAYMAIEELGSARVAARLVEDWVLPTCYRARYDDRFLTSFRNLLGVTRNLLVSDCPFVPNTAAELAAGGILSRASVIAVAGGDGWEQEAAAVDPRLPEQLSLHGDHLKDELESLAGATLEDSDVLALFDLPSEPDPVAHLPDRLRPDELALLRFENWLSPFGNAPRPYVTYDGRAWPVTW